MTTWTLSYEIHGDSNNSGGQTAFYNILNGVTLPVAFSPIDTGHVPGVPLWGHYSADVTGIFNPDVNNHLSTGYTGTGSYSYVMDYGSIAKLKIEGSDGTVYYGEYPIGHPYPSSLYESGFVVAGDGDFPPIQWNQITQAYDQFPLDENGNQTGNCHFYFTVPTAPGSTAYSFHFQLRADTATGTDGDLTTVNVKWYAGASVYDLGNYTSLPGTPTGDAPWKDFTIDVTDKFDPAKTNKAEISRVGSIEVDVTPAQIWHDYNFSELILAEQPTTVYKTSAASSARLLTNTGAGAWRYSVSLTPGATYHIYAWIRAVAGDASNSLRECDLEMQSSLTLTQYTLMSSVHFDSSAWTLLSGYFTCPAGETQFDILLQGNAGLYLPGGWSMYVSDWSLQRVEGASSTSTDDAHIRWVYLRALEIASSGWTMLNGYNPPSVIYPFLISSGKVTHDPTKSGAPENSGAFVDVGRVASEVTLTYYNSGSICRFSIFLAMDPDVGSCYAYVPWRSGAAAMTKYTGHFQNKQYYEGMASSAGVPPNGTVIRVTYDGVNTLKVYWNGVLKQTVVDDGSYLGPPLTSSSNTWAGFAVNEPTESIAGFSASGAVTFSDNFNRDDFMTVGTGTVLSTDYGQYPQGFDYIEDVEDGLLGNGPPTVYSVEGSYDYVVPNGVTQLIVEAWGAQGANEWAFPGDIFGGKGGYIKSQIAVTSGETLKVFVGGTSINQNPGFGGGGAGLHLSGGGVAGGGGTDIRRAPYGLNDRLVVAGGGGGAGSGYSTGQSGGHGGALVGADGRNSYGNGGTGGTQSAGGVHGSNNGWGPDGGDGGFGYGGDASIYGGSYGYGQGNGGGGGGWYGGGAGSGQGAGGGGGSNHTSGTVIANAQGVQSGTGKASITTIPLVILNDGGTLPDAPYFAQQGVDTLASAANYTANFSLASAGDALNGFQGWVADPAGWYYDNQGAMVLEIHQHGEGTQFNAFGHSLALHSDNLRAAPKHHIVVGLSYYGSRGSNGEGAVWGYNGPNDYWYAMPSSDFGTGRIGRISGGVETIIAPFDVDSSVQITVDHNFLTGALTVDTYEYFLGNTTHYAGTHPWSVVNGKVGFLGRHQSGGGFWTSARCTGFQLIYSLADLASNKQYSMQTHSVVQQTPATWYFKIRKLSKWIVGAVGW